MAYDEGYAADVLRRLCREASCHTVILGAGSNTRLALHRLDDARGGSLRAILDDDPSLRGTRIFGLEVHQPSDYPLDRVDRVVITSETYQAELTARARELFAPDVPIDYTFDRAQSFASRLTEIQHELETRFGDGGGPDPPWQAADRLYRTLHRRLRGTPTWRYGPDRQIAEFQDLGRQLRPFARWQGCSALNFGCGRFHPLGISLLAQTAGAAHTTATDVQPMLDEAVSAQATAELINEIVLDPQAALGETAPSRAEAISRVETLLDLTRLRSGELVGAIRSADLAYRVESIYDSSLPAGAYDVVTSRSVFEHLPDVPRALDALNDVLAVGGVFLLTIDFCDHRVYQDPGRYRHWSHLRDLDEPTYLGTNRLRYPDYPPMFERAGFRIERYAAGPTDPVPSEDKSKLPDRYRAMSDADLAVTTAVAVLRKIG